MTGNGIYHSLSLISPEIVLSAALLILVIADLIFHKDKRIIPYIALAGLAFTGAFLIANIGVSGFAFTSN